MLTFTRKAYLEVWRDGRYISRHQGLLEAGESASRDADEHGSGDYEIRIGAEVYYMARADVTIFSSSSQPAFARPAGAAIGGEASAVAAGASSSVDASVSITGASVVGSPNAVTVGAVWLQGVGGYNPTSDPPLWEAWMGRLPEIVICWIANTSNNSGTWSALENSCAGTGTAFNWNETLDNFGGDGGTEARRTIPIIVSVPMCPNNLSNSNAKNSSLWGNFAAGNYDGNWTTIANNLKSALTSHGRNGNGDTLIIRLGWEMNGNWYPWALAGANATQSANNITNYKTAWNRTTNIIKGIMPQVRFDWSPAVLRIGYYYDGGRNYSAVGNGLTILDALPSQNVSNISRSTHDAHDYTTNLGTGSGSFHRNHVDPLSFGSKEYGLQELYDAAQSRGCTWSLSEWATQLADCTTPCVEATNFCTAPSPQIFLQGVYEFLSSHQTGLAWDTYFDISCTRLESRQGTAAAQYYKANWA